MKKNTKISFFLFFQEFRIKILHCFFQFGLSAKEADAIAQNELEALFGTESKYINLDDPAEALRNDLRQKETWTDDFVKE